MSSYDCVLPISWPVLHDEIVPAWCQVLEGQRSCLSFCEEFRIEHDPFIGIDEYDWSAIPRGYLIDVGWSRSLEIFMADQLRESTAHARLVSLGIAEVGIDILMAVCKKRAGVDLGKPDPFARSHYGKFYGRLEHPRRLQVAGTKSRYHFLEGMFTLTDEPELYRYTNARTVPEELVHLLGALFLALRALPGILVLPRGWCWPAYDDDRMQGYLTPSEVQQLVPYLDLIPAYYAHNPKDDLFPLFADRVRRAAAQELGLITFHSGLL